MSDQLWEALKIFLAFVFGGFGLEVFKKWSNKRRENLEQVKLYEEGSKLQIEVRTNIDKVVEEKTKQLNFQISELKETIIQISTRYKNDLDNYIDRMADLEKKFDVQLARNRSIEDKLQSEIDNRENCLEELKKIRSKISDIEEKTS